MQLLELDKRRSLHWGRRISLTAGTGPDFRAAHRTVTDPECVSHHRWITEDSLDNNTSLQLFSTCMAHTPTPVVI